MKLVAKLSLLIVGSALIGCAGAPNSDSTAESEEALTRVQCRGSADARCRIAGTVEKMVVGEFDPYEVGDACVTFVRVGNKRYGLVRDMESCPDSERYEQGDIAITFSKGDITPVGRRKADVLKEYESGVTYYTFDGELTETSAGVDPLTEFNRLGQEEKLAFMFERTQGGTWATVRAGFSRKPVRLVDELTGEVLRRALDAYRPLASHSYANGGSQPEVYAVEKRGVRFGYAIEASGRSYGNWGSIAIFDHQFQELGEFGYAD